MDPSRNDCLYKIAHGRRGTREEVGPTCGRLYQLSAHLEGRPQTVSRGRRAAAKADAAWAFPSCGHAVAYPYPATATSRQMLDAPRARAVHSFRSSLAAARVSGLPAGRARRAEGPAAATIPAGRRHGIQSEGFGVSDEPGRREHCRDAHQRATGAHGVPWPNDRASTMSNGTPGGRYSAVLRRCLSEWSSLRLA
jgi:hypothetical protein